MKCKVCSYESNENFSVCPYCGEGSSLQSQSYSDSPLITKENKSYNSSDVEKIEKFLKTCGSFENNQNELTMTTSLSEGDFAKWSIVVIVSEALLLLFSLQIVTKMFPDINSGLFILLFFVLLAISVYFINSCKLKVDSSGITIKTVFKKYFIPKEKIVSLNCKIVKRTVGKRQCASFYDIFIIMKDKSFFNKVELDTGLCYMDKIHTDYLIDKFNEHLGI